MPKTQAPQRVYEHTAAGNRAYRALHDTAKYVLLYEISQFERGPFSRNEWLERCENDEQRIYVDEYAQARKLVPQEQWEAAAHRLVMEVDTTLAINFVSSEMPPQAASAVLVLSEDFPDAEVRERAARALRELLGEEA